MAAKANTLYETQTLIDPTIMKLIFLVTTSVEVNVPSKSLKWYFLTVSLNIHGKTDWSESHRTVTKLITAS